MTSERMLGRVAFRRFTGIVLTGLLLAGCGGSDNTSREQAQSGSTSSEQTDPDERCTSSVAQAPVGTLRQALEEVCRAAIEQGRMDDGELSNDDLLGVLRDDPSILEPVCAEGATRGFAALPPSAREYIDLTPEAWGESLCEAIIEGDYFDADDTLTPEAMTRLYRDHPELGAPFLFAGLMEGYDPSLGVPKATFEEIARRAATEAFKRGLVTARSFSDFDADEAAFLELIDEIAAQYAVE